MSLSFPKLPVSYIPFIDSILYVIVWLPLKFDMKKAAESCQKIDFFFGKDNLVKRRNRGWSGWVTSDGVRSDDQWSVWHIKKRKSVYCEMMHRSKIPCYGWTFKRGFDKRQQCETKYYKDKMGKCRRFPLPCQVNLNY